MQAVTIYTWFRLGQYAVGVEMAKQYSVILICFQIAC